MTPASEVLGAPSFETCLASRKGLGLFATRDIPRGACILSEAPLLTLSPSDRSITTLWKHLETLSETDFNQYAALSATPAPSQDVDPGLRELSISRLAKYKHYAGVPLALAVQDELQLYKIFKFNVVFLGRHDTAGTACGIFSTSSRINHSCLPNCKRTWNSTLKHLTLYALRDIKAGEELLITYVDPTEPCNTRAKLLAHRWRIDCDCEACEGPQAMMHEKRREKIATLAHGLVAWADGNLRGKAMPRSLHDALHWAEELVATLKLEGLEDDVLVEALATASKHAYAVGQVSLAHTYAQQALEVERCCLGTSTAHLEDNEQGLSAKRLVREMETAIEKDQVKIRMNQKREAKEEKRMAKKAEKKGRVCK